MSETLRATFRRVLRLENRRAAVRPGRIEHISGFTSSILGNAREITVYLPAGYDEREDRRYPVLYMQDGQNLFDATRAYVPGQHWRLQEAADAAIGERTAFCVQAKRTLCGRLANVGDRLSRGCEARRAA